MEMLKLFQDARNVSVPIVLIRTVDQTATIEMLKAEALAGFPVIEWGAVRGLTAPGSEKGADALDAAGKARMARLAKERNEPSLKNTRFDFASTVNFVEALLLMRELPQGAAVFCRNAQRQLMSSEPAACAPVIQGIADLREEFKMNFRMLVLVGPQTLVAPPELEQDVIILDDALPDDDALQAIVNETYASVKLPAPKADVLAKAVEALGGLSSFAAEQVTAMSIRDTGLDIAALWQRKRVAIEQTPGLTVWPGKETFADIIGQDALKRHLRRRINAKRPLGVVVWIDEIDKALANVESDTSGVRMYQFLKLLTEMENNEWPGFVGVGVAGGGKSLIAKALGNEAGVPTMGLDFGATESKYVGESEANMLRVLQIIKSVGRGNAYFVATSNAATVMRPELQRRFTDGMWMFDLMTDAERQAAWTFYFNRYGLAPQPLPDDDAWTGAEIRNCCRYAYETSVSVVEAASIIVPMARSRADEVERLRLGANGKFLDVHKGGPYHYSVEPMQKQVRAIALPKDILTMVETMKES